jgi:hypothetical protein
MSIFFKRGTFITKKKKSQDIFCVDDEITATLYWYKKLFNDPLG